MQDDAFGHWLAGFIDGEGCFLVATRPAAGAHIYCLFRLETRADDRPILDEIRERLGVGTIRLLHRGKYHGAVWSIQSKAGCATLVEFLDRYPLRAKKSRDYAVWREAVMEWLTVTPGGRGRAYDWTRMEDLRVALLEARRVPAEYGLG